ncbi:MAG TPA: DUF5004 domain-containing protein [Chitinophagaceae bacterium]|jgi:hypothetical protein|nr:DUF5004 domain-containing protein [Chitinophagaceae bacterium]
MKKQLFILFMFIICLALLSSCKKDKDKEPAKTLVGKWKQIAGTYSPAYYGETDYFSSYPPCDKDDIIEFKSDNTYELNEGATKCDASDPQILITGNYSVNTDFTTLNILGQTVNIELTTNSLKVTTPFTDNGVTYTDVSSYRRQ